MKRLIVIGAGGHAAVVADALIAAGEMVIGFTDSDSSRQGVMLCGLLVLGDDSVLEAFDRRTHQLANGVCGARGTSARQRLQHHFLKDGWQFAEVRHPSAVVSGFAKLGGGVQLFAGSVVQPGAILAEGCIVNTGAVVEHDCRLGEHAHIAPRAVVCGGATIGARSHIGAGAVVRQGIFLADDTIVGAGAIVLRSYSDSCTLVGNPARRLEPRS
jgi:sugar O-acyltransferase (sialic acid O-acetyltransferase NeuD family)